VDRWRGPCSIRIAPAAHFMTTDPENIMSIPSMGRVRRIALGVGILPFAAMWAACSDGPLDPDDDQLVTHYLSSGFVVNDARQQTFAATFNRAAVPTDGTGDFPVLTFGDGPVSAVRGGSIVIGLDSPTPVARVMVGVTGQEGRYDVDLAGSQALRNEADGSARFEDGPSRVMAQVQYTPVRPGAALVAGEHLELVLAIPNDPSLGDFEVAFAVEYGSGASVRAAGSSRSRISTLKIQLLDDGSPGGLSFTIKWGPAVDVDLHVVTPSGVRIGYDNPAAEGGRLSVDTNAGCDRNPGTTEKIEWGSSPAPVPGVYAFGPNYYDSCQELRGDVGPVPVTITLNNGLVQGVYRVVLQPSDANFDARLDPGKTTWAAVLAPKDTDNGLLARLLVHENPPPGAGIATPEIMSGMEATRAVVFNRLGSKNTHISNAPANAGIREIITARNQFQGFSGGMSRQTEEEVDRRLVAFSSQMGIFRPYWESLFQLLKGPVSDPYTGVTRIGQKDVMPGAWAMFASGGKGPGGSFIAIPATQNGVIAGNQYYTLPAGFR
jgi:uncharacterized protein YfaP (DUF2135 family)